jgi:hypothetical protein
MRRPFFILLAVISALVLGAPAAVAGSAHFINNAFTISRSGDTLTVAGKEAGLGDLLQVHIEVTATALCINGGGNHPKAVNKADLTAEGDFPVQNGKADFSLSLTATFQPECSPPMTVAFTDVTVTDTTNGISKSFSGTF